MMTAVIKIQGKYRSKIARGKVHGRRLEKAKETKWYACDDGEGNVYYYSTDTGECMWEKPSDFDEDSGKDAPDILKTMMQKAFEVTTKPEPQKQNMRFFFPCLLDLSFLFT
jgi:hypothetical protein